MIPLAGAVGSEKGSTPLLQDILQAVLEDVTLTAPSIAPQVKQAMEAWRMERSHIIQQLSQSKSTEERQILELEDFDEQVCDHVNQVCQNVISRSIDYHFAVSIVGN